MGLFRDCAHGLRNTWKWSFDRVTGDLWAGDVGQNEIEEVDLIVKGGNYGWDPMEGPAGKNDGTMILPVYSYPHGNGTCVIGGHVYRGNPASKYYGTYFFTDETKHDIWTLRKVRLRRSRQGADAVHVHGDRCGRAPVRLRAHHPDRLPA
jgi:glucose/arabinose dehydrogenase